MEISVGNILTMVIMVVGFIVTIWKISTFISGKFSTIESTIATTIKDVQELRDYCSKCYLKNKVEVIEGKQEDLRRELPEQLGQINGAINLMKADLRLIKHKLDIPNE